MNTLTPREREVLEQYAIHGLYKNVAHAMNLAEQTVRNYGKSALSKLNAASIGQAAILYDRERQAASAVPISWRDRMTFHAPAGSKIELNPVPEAAAQPQPSGALRDFIESVAATSNDSHLAQEAQRILNRLDDPERAALAAEYARLSAEQPQELGSGTPEPDPQVIEGYIDPSGRGRGNWWKG